MFAGIVPRRFRGPYEGSKKEDTRVRLFRFNDMEQDLMETHYLPQGWIPFHMERANDEWYVWAYRMSE